MDKRLGKIDGTDTKVCAVTGQDVSAGMIRYALHDGYYFRVKPRAQKQVTPELIAELTALIPTSKSKRKIEAVSEAVDNDN